MFHVIWEFTPISGEAQTAWVGIPQCTFSTVNGRSDPVPHWTGHLVGSALTLQTPTGGEELTGGGTYAIYWESTPDIAAVAVEFSDNDGTSYSPVDILPNLHRHIWNIPMVTCDNCLLRITDAADSNAVNVSASFTVNSCVESLTADRNGDCLVNFVDLGFFADQWLQCGDPGEANCIN